MAKAKAKTKKAPSKAKKVTKAESDKGLKSLKFPKALRNFAPVKDLMNSDLGREILADALIAAAGAAAAAITRSRRVRNTGKAFAETGAHAARDAITASGTVAGVVADAARHLLPASLMGEHEEMVEAPRRRKSTRKASGGSRGSNPPQYAHLATDHSKRKTSKKAPRSTKDPET
ncbi:hypothetical protein AB4072_03255 [Microvirga sp. 2MCAF38]|uniref:hypothetical protein n=1 Tax=Microvirga sp. 2MCAF38 TaxID=3232989 RepID=UPI003F9A9B77